MHARNSRKGEVDIPTGQPPAEESKQKKSLKTRFIGFQQKIKQGLGLALGRIRMRFN